jgi:hypothetical protein
MRVNAAHSCASHIARSRASSCSSAGINKCPWNKDYMHDSNALTRARERRIDDRFQVREDGNDALIHHRFTLPKFFFGFRSAEALWAFDSDRNRANRTPG